MFKSISILFLFIFAISLVLLSINHAEALGPEKPCEEWMSDNTKAQLSLMSACNKEVKLKTPKEKKEKSGCILRCLLRKVGMINDEYLLDQKKIDVMTNEMPANLYDKAVPLFNSCNSIASSLDPKDPFCKSYNALVQCLINVMKNMCK